MTGLPLALSITLLVICIILLCAVVRLIGQGRLQIRYALLWMALALVMLLCVVFPSVVSTVSSFLGFGYASNFVLYVGIVVLLVISLSLSMVVSWQARYIRSLIQTCALLDNRISKLENDDASSCEESEPEATEADS